MCKCFANVERNFSNHLNGNRKLNYNLQVDWTTAIGYRKLPEWHATTKLNQFIQIMCKFHVTLLSLSSGWRLADGGAPDAVSETFPFRCAPFTTHTQHISRRIMPTYGGQISALRIKERKCGRTNPISRSLLQMRTDGELVHFVYPQDEYLVNEYKSDGAI